MSKKTLEQQLNERFYNYLPGSPGTLELKKDFNRYALLAFIHEVYEKGYEDCRKFFELEKNILIADK